MIQGISTHDIIGIATSATKGLGATTLHYLQQIDVELIILILCWWLDIRLAQTVWLKLKKASEPPGIAFFNVL